VQGEGKKDLDSDGVWAGKWTFWVRLYMDIAGGGGVVHPPAFFGNESRRGYLVYPGQPLICRRCGDGGHYAAQCTTVLCSRCQSRDHVIRDCVSGVRRFSGVEVGVGDKYCKETETMERKGKEKRVKAVAVKSRSVERVCSSDTEGDSEDGDSENGADESVSVQSVRSCDREGDNGCGVDGQVETGVTWVTVVKKGKRTRRAKNGLRSMNTGNGGQCKESARKEVVKGELRNVGAENGRGSINVSESQGNAGVVNESVCRIVYIDEDEKG
ncbi:ZCHC3 protein, partial [Atractosteus spatula]|nr:ZCHC3 protein [Atractosteus spatula]